MWQVFQGSRGALGAYTALLLRRKQKLSHQLKILVHESLCTPNVRVVWASQKDFGIVNPYLITSCVFWEAVTLGALLPQLPPQNIGPALRGERSSYLTPFCPQASCLQVYHLKTSRLSLVNSLLLSPHSEGARKSRNARLEPVFTDSISVYPSATGGGICSPGRVRESSP